MVDNGFRLPSAFDNRPLTLDEFFDKVGQIVYVSATPSDYEIEKSNNNIVELLIRPTGIVEPQVDIRKTEKQLDDLYEEIKNCIQKKKKY